MEWRHMVKLSRYFQKLSNEVKKSKGQAVEEWQEPDGYEESEVEVDDSNRQRSWGIPTKNDTEFGWMEKTLRSNVFLKTQQWKPSMYRIMNQARPERQNAKHSRVAFRERTERLAFLRGIP